MSGELHRKFCQHCEEYLAPRTFREHLRIFYDGNSHTWTKRRKVYVGDDESLDLSLADDESLDPSLAAN